LSQNRRLDGQFGHKDIAELQDKLFFCMKIGVLQKFELKSSTPFRGNMVGANGWCVEIVSAKGLGQRVEGGFDPQGTSLRH